MSGAGDLIRAAVNRFYMDEGGAMTVEWVAIAAAVVVGAVAVTYSVIDNLDPVSAQVGTSLQSVPSTLPPQPNYADGQG